MKKIVKFWREDGKALGFCEAYDLVFIIYSDGSRATLDLNRDTVTEWMPAPLSDD